MYVIKIKLYMIIFEEAAYGDLLSLVPLSSLILTFIPIKRLAEKNFP